MRQPGDWKELDLGDGVRLLLGWRSGRRDLEAAPADLDRTIAQEMREAGVQTLERLAGLDRRTFSGVPAVETDQYLSLPLAREEDSNDDGDTASDGDEDSEEVGSLLPEEAAATAQLIELVQAAFDDDDFLGRSDLKGGGWLFYAVVVELEDEDDPVAFVRKYNPQRGIRAGRLAASAKGKTLTRFDDPFFNFDVDFDLVVAPDEMAILNVNAFNSVFADLELAKLQVPEHVASFSKDLGVPLPRRSAAVLEAVCAQKPSLANRVRRLAHAAYLPKITAQSLGDALDKHGWPRTRLGRQQVRLGDAEDVTLFLELAEGLFYEADFSEERRRADRFSLRS